MITDRALIRKHFPYLSERTAAVVHPRRCGWLSAQQVGMHMLEQSRENVVAFRQGRLEKVDLSGGRVEAVHLREGSGDTRISTGNLVNAAGSFFPHVARMIGVELPVSHELHLKIAFRDPLRVVGRDAPLLIWTDPATLPWSGLKFHYPAEFTCALLNGQPMGFYTPATIVDDAKRHGVIVLSLDVQRSLWHCTLEPRGDGTGEWAVRMGLRYVKGCGEADAARIARERRATPFTSLEDDCPAHPLERRTSRQACRGRRIRELGHGSAERSLG